MNINKVSIFINDEWEDISNSIQTSKIITIQYRCDEAFATGSFTAWLDKKNNIPPFTLLKINEEMFFCSSEATKYLTNNKWVHEFTILELTAILECFILGTKVFSTTGTNTYDYQKVIIIRELMAQKYNYYLSFDSFKDILYDKHIFTFMAGQTIFSILTEIGSKYNCRPVVTSIDGQFIRLDFVKLDNDSFYEIENKRIENIKLSQKNEQYCKYLESEISNVVDRNNLSIAKNLTVRCEDIQISFESGKLFLPTRIESVEKLFIGASGELTFYNIDGKYLDAFRKGYSEYTGWSYNIPTYSQPLEDWFYEINESGKSIVEGPIYKLFDKFITDSKIASEDVDKLRYEMKWKLVAGTQLIENSEGQLDWIFSLEWDSTNDFKCMKDISSIVLEKDLYDLLEARERPKYCYYTSGDNTICGLGVVYKDDFWNTLLGNRETSCLSHIQNDTNDFKSYVDSESGIKSTYKVGVNNADPRFNIFDIHYVSIANPIMIDTKKIVEPNEIECKKFSRTYDISSEMIDFDLLTASMKKVNEMYGRIEATIEYDVSNISHPKVTQKVLIENETYYITAISLTHTMKRSIATMFLSKSYYKVAEAIGVKTQFNATKNPLNSIVERPIYFASNANVEIPNDAFMRIKTYKRNGKEISTLYKRFSIFSSEDKLCCYTETLDQYAFDYISKKADNFSTYYCSELVPYVDDNNEVYSIEIAIVNLLDMSIDYSRELPLYTGQVEEIVVSDNKIVFKDARERLTFTFDLPNATLKQ